MANNVDDVYPPGWIAAVNTVGPPCGGQAGDSLHKGMPFQEAPPGPLVYNRPPDAPFISPMPSDAVVFDGDPNVYVELTEEEKLQRDVKESNPKDAIGITKIPLRSVMSEQVLGEVALGMLEGACKYGRHNYRVIGVRASVYYDAAGRHLDAWWSGEDMDSEAAVLVHHIPKTISDLMVLYDAILQGKFFDDRPPRVKNRGWIQDLNRRTKELLSKFANPKPPYIQGKP